MDKIGDLVRIMVDALEKDDSAYRERVKLLFAPNEQHQEFLDQAREFFNSVIRKAPPERHEVLLDYMQALVNGTLNPSGSGLSGYMAQTEAVHIISDGFRDTDQGLRLKAVFKRAKVEYFIIEEEEDTVPYVGFGTRGYIFDGWAHRLKKDILAVYGSDWSTSSEDFERDLGSFLDFELLGGEVYSCSHEIACFGTLTAEKENRLVSYLDAFGMTQGEPAWT